MGSVINMKKAWIIKTGFTPLFLSDCELNRTYLKKKWTSINDLAQPVDITNEQRSTLVKTVIGWLNATYPDLKRVYNRDNKHLSVYYLEKTALEGSLPSFLGTSINEALNIMIVTIFQEVYADRNKWLPALHDLTILFKDCQQVQYRAITEVYKKVKNMGSLETRVSAVVDSWKYTWFRRLIEQNVGANVDPHTESYYMAQLGDELGLIETDAAKGDRLAPPAPSVAGYGQQPRVDIVRLMSILWDKVVNVQEVFDDIYNVFRGNGLTEDERVLSSAGMA